METPLALEDHTVNELQSLIRLNIDSAAGYRAAAERVADTSLAERFRQHARQGDSFAQDLQRFVRLNNEIPAEHGTVTGSLHRWWLDIRGAIEQGDEHAMLAEAERGEQAIRDQYKEVMRRVPATPLNDVLLRQFAQVKRRHDEIRELLEDSS